MNQYVKMILFVIILGTVTSAILVGMDLWTSDRIEANKEVEIKATLLDAYDIEYNYNTIHDIFDDSVTIHEIGNLIVYEDNISKAVSFIFEGSGVWGPIIGMITLEDDFETIVAVAILQQEETPGLGGVIAEPKFLAQFPGVKMVPELLVLNNPDINLPNEIDGISGGTRTSIALRDILNNTYTIYKEAWETHNGAEAGS
ncbi:MAG: FMN-binding protein [Acholeplasmataceae bacterium]|nr:FMN-binding protein [Acholeplasmataceae bacterium]